VNGLAVATDPAAADDNQVRAALPTAGVAVTISYKNDGAGEAILQTFRAATP
jgi:hypothetical protein